MERPVLSVVGVLCLVAAVLWGRSAQRLLRACLRIEADVAASSTGQESGDLARSAFRKEAHTTVLYAVLGAALLGTSFVWHRAADAAMLALLIPIALTLRFGPRFLAEARLAEHRSMLERRAEEVLRQEELAPRQWAARLAPEDLPEIPGFEVGRVYEPGTGMMAGDFYDLYPTSPTRLAAVIGDVSGHGIEPSITAFQVKYLLRVFLRQYRDPGQALEELNKVLSTHGRPEELVSLIAAVYDLSANTLRVASAGHPPAWLWHDGEVRALTATGPLLTLDPEGTYTSTEVSLEPGDLLLMYTDGLAEARAGDALFGEERVAAHLRRDPGQDASLLCKSLLEAARDFASAPLGDDVAILAIRRT